MRRPPFTAAPPNHHVLPGSAPLMDRLPFAAVVALRRVPFAPVPAIRRVPSGSAPARDRLSFLSLGPPHPLALACALALPVGLALLAGRKPDAARLDFQARYRRALADAGLGRNLLAFQRAWR